MGCTQRVGTRALGCQKRSSGCCGSSITRGRLLCPWITCCPGEMEAAAGPQRAARVCARWDEAGSSGLEEQGSEELLGTAQEHGGMPAPSHHGTRHPEGPPIPHKLLLPPPAGCGRAARSGRWPPCSHSLKQKQNRGGEGHRVLTTTIPSPSSPLCSKINPTPAKHHPSGDIPAATTSLFGNLLLNI